MVRKHKNLSPPESLVNAPDPDRACPQSSILCEVGDRPAGVRRRRPRRGLPAILLLSLLPGACSPAPAGPDGLLRVATWAGAAESRLEERVLEEYRRRHPEVRVVLQPIPGGGYRETVLTSIAAGRPPAVFLVDNASNAFLRRDLLVELDRYGERVGWDEAAYFPQAVRTFRGPGGGLFAFPKDLTPMVIFYNRDLFDRAGLPYPADDWTWDDFLGTARALTRDRDGDGEPDEYGTALLRDLYLWQPWVWAAGGDILDPTGRRATGYLDSPETVRALRFLVDLARRHRVVPSFELRRWGTNASRMFFAGRLGMLESGHWFLTQALRHQEAGRIRLGVAPLPRPRGGSSVTVVYAAGWAVPRSAPHRRRAVELAAWLSGPEAQRIRAEARLAIPAHRGVAAELAAGDTLGLEALFLRVLPSARAPWGTRVERFLEVEDLVPTILDRALVAGEPVESAAREVARRLDRILAR